MNRIFFFLLIVLLLPVSVAARAAEELQAIDYNLTMAGSLINNWCEPNWEASAYLTINACNYQLAQLYDLETSGKDFDQCTVIAGGDIVRIAECMVARFDIWLAEAGLATSSEDSAQ